MGEEKYEGRIESREYMPEQDGSGMGLTGRWLNRQTGQVVNVRNTIIDGENMLIITDNGQIPMTIFSRDYIQASDEIYDESGKVVGHEAVTVEDYGQNDDWAQIQEALKGNLSQSQVQQPVINHNDSIIKKVFDKLTSFPEVEVNIKWDNFPDAQINTLVNFLDVKLEDISTYIINNYVNNQALSESVKKILEDKLN